jgi:hypothetical protein
VVRERRMLEKYSPRLEASVVGMMRIQLAIGPYLGACMDRVLRRYSRPRLEARVLTVRTVPLVIGLHLVEYVPSRVPRVT